MKIAVNNFYATKIQFFTELFLLSKETKSDYRRVKGMMLRNGWINPMHTTIPGHDGQISYGGMCFPKDTNALLSFMRSKKMPCEVIQATVSERDLMRAD